ncbi:sigma-54 dependent transcriptional regulator [Niveibacterium sp. 24ML]|uniref:sigma-54-dependent transcriptional regulator n=1 Tax=Niveibacterium sp. 24ML TaxID=2985512 RepID=UPI002271EC3A|nr:sigma-54 dependent transcriptional regulator [Niveibacterium sp. 24ML]MCX9157872.1 sigma-54 dependent transcriptional regulator [Niveibacterium sp. 24ML]
MARILVADDDEGVRSFLVEALARDGHQIVEAANGIEALDALRGDAFDLVLSDLRMPGVDGIQVLRAARALLPAPEVLILTAYGAVPTAVEAIKLGASDFLEKPVASPAAIRDKVKGMLAHRVSAASSASAGPPQLSWGAPAMQPVVHAVERVARTAATVLLQGETGTGKEVLARAIHAGSPRASGPFMAINCAVLTESLLESELFGHEKGAFTGAHALRVGRIELARGGSFFLDEVGELQPPMQAKLLRVIEERSFERVGGSRAITADVRWIAATHRDLRAMVRDGRFREDLYHRLAVFPIRLPPLRERPEDIEPIARALLQQLAAAAGRSSISLSDDALARIRAARWPGNVRELRNALERALIVADGERLCAADIVLEHDMDEPAVAGDAHESLEQIERRSIARALDAAGGHRAEAARRLGIGLRTLYDKIKRYGL